MTRPDTRPTRGPIVLPSHTDPVPAGLSEAIGGPVGRHALLRRRFWTPVRIVLALTCLMLAFSWVQKSPCRDGAWQDYSQYRNACYTDVLALYYAEELNAGKMPYFEHNVEYPVLTGLMMAAVGLPIHAFVASGNGQRLLDVMAALHLAEGGPPNEGKWFYDATAIVLGAFGLLTVWALAAGRRRRPWDAAMFALAPALLVTATVNWDLLAIGFTALGIYAWSKKHPVAAGVLLGLGVAAKFYPLLILGPLLLLCLRKGTGKAISAGFATVAVTAGTWFAVNLPFILFANEGWKTFYSLSRERGVDWGTFWYIGSHVPRRSDDGQQTLGIEPFNWLGAHISTLNTVAWLLFALCCVGIAALIFLAPRRPRLGTVAFLVVAMFLLTNKVWSQQFVLWLIPLAILARPRWRMFLAWQAAELFYFFAFYQILLRTSGGKALLPEIVFTIASAARWITVAVLCGFVIREALRPEADVVRRGGVDDPEGGVLDESEPDEPVVRPPEPALTG